MRLCTALLLAAFGACSIAGMARIRVATFQASDFTVVQLARCALEPSSTEIEQSHADEILDTVEELLSVSRPLLLKIEKLDPFERRAWREAAADVMIPRHELTFDALAFRWVRDRAEKVMVPGQWAAHAHGMRKELAGAAESKRSLGPAPAAAPEGEPG